MIEADKRVDFNWGVYCHLGDKIPLVLCSSKQQAEHMRKFWGPDCEINPIAPTLAISIVEKVYVKKVFDIKVNE